MLLILTALELNTFLNRSSVLLVIKICKKIIFRIQTHDSVMCGYFCIGFVDYILTSKTLIDYTNLCLLYGFKKNDKT